MIERMSFATLRLLLEMMMLNADDGERPAYLAEAGYLDDRLALRYHHRKHDRMFPCSISST